ncbi:MAG: Crp/Fnr family transcriptional regulator [Bacteroidales bacterium]|jgi:CRP-like cAMP-binding protein|nr:Crp/Fnr family transcriptional regulator [Bacteroidales bacterium]
MRLDENSIKKYNLTDEEIKLTMSSYKPKSYKANEFFLEEGQVCNAIGFVTRGLFRSFFYDDHGNEITTDFFPAGTLIIAFDSFNNRTPSREFIRAIVESEVMSISYEKQKELYAKVPAWNQICKDLADVKSHEMTERSKRFQTLSATERYHLFCKEYPDILQQATLGHIASYLGVDIATLSRIRRKK